MVLSVKDHLIKISTDYFFYIGGIVLGSIYYVTGLTPEKMISIMFIIFADMGTRIWAEKVNGRPILSKKMWYGFFGKFTSYMVLFTVANHAFYVGEILDYIVFGGFSLIEARSVFENLKEARQGHLDIIGRKIEREVSRFEDE